MSTDDMRAIIAVDRRQATAKIQDNLELVLGFIPEDDRAAAMQLLSETFNQVAAINSLVHDAEDSMRDAHATVMRSLAAAEEMEKQRDLIADELHRLVYALENLDGNNVTVERAVEQVFDELLPAEVASAIFDGDVEGANTLIAAMTGTLDDERQLAKSAEFRHHLRQLVEWMQDA